MEGILLIKEGAPLGKLDGTEVGFSDNILGRELGVSIGVAEGILLIKEGISTS